MGKVVPFKKPDKQESKSTPSTRLDYPDFLANLTSGLGTLGIEIDPKLWVLGIEAHLNSLRGHVLNETVAIRRQGLRDHSLDQLHDIARKSTKNDWTSKPAYYRALVDEINSRQ